MVNEFKKVAKEIKRLHKETLRKRKLKQIKNVLTEEELQASLRRAKGKIR